MWSGVNEPYLTFATHCLTTYVSCPRLHDAFSHGRRIYSGSNPCQNSKSTPRNPDLPVELPKITFDLIILTDRAPPAAFWVPYNDDERNTGLGAFLLVWTATHSKLASREFQLEATIAIMSGRDSLIDVGTGYGKTLCVIIFCLLNPESLFVIFFPLERLQAVQVLEFECYGIKTLVINADTPNDPDLWNVRPRKVLLGIVWSH